MVQTVGRQPVSAGLISCRSVGFLYRQSGTGTGFSRSVSFHPCPVLFNSYITDAM